MRQAFRRWPVIPEMRADDGAPCKPPARQRVDTPGPYRRRGKRPSVTEFQDCSVPQVAGLDGPSARGSTQEDCTRNLEFIRGQPLSVEDCTNCVATSPLILDLFVLHPHWRKCAGRRAPTCLFRFAKQ